MARKITRRCVESETHVTQFANRHLAFGWENAGADHDVPSILDRIGLPVAQIQFKRHLRILLPNSQHGRQ